MRIAILSDIHGNIAALDAVLADVQRRGVDQIVNLGDSLSGPLFPLETAQFLMQQAWPTLAGNHERQILAQDAAPRGLSDAYAFAQLSQTELDWIAALPKTATIKTQINGADILLCHGTPECDLIYFLETVDAHHFRLASAFEVTERLGAVTAPVVLCGHTHLARSVRSASGQLIVNPGSVGLQAYDALLPYPHKVENGSPDARYAILEHGAQGWTAALLSVPYDHVSMAAQSKRVGRADWVHALMTGYMPINLGE